MNSGTQIPGTSASLPLSTDQMVEVGQVLLEAYRDVLDNQSEESRPRIASFVAEFCLRTKPYILVTPEGLAGAIETVFSDPRVTDFVLTLVHIFGSRWGMTQERLNSLATNLASGAALPVTSELRSIPNALASRLASFPDAYHLLVANPWLVVLMLLQLFFNAQATGSTTSR